LKAVYDHFDYDSSTDEHRKMLHIMYGCSWDIMPRRVIKTLHRAVVAATPAPRAVPHQKWMEMMIGFDTSNCPKNMEGVEQLPLLIALTIANIRMYHVLVDGGAALNLISRPAFKRLQIPMSQLAPSRPFIGVGPGSIMTCGSISLPVTFGTPKNYRTESVLFNVAELNLSLNAS
jgi:hypothetical protein